MPAARSRYVIGQPYCLKCVPTLPGVSQSQNKGRTHSWYFLQQYDRITVTIRDSLHWLPVQQRIDYKLCVRVYKCLHQAAPIYLSELCIPVASFTGRSHLRSAVKECLVISYCRTKNYGQRSFSYSGPTLWNSLPLTVRDSSMSLSQFCSRLKTEMFCRAYY